MPTPIRPAVTNRRTLKSAAVAAPTPEPTEPVVVPAAAPPPEPTKSVEVPGAVSDQAADGASVGSSDGTADNISDGSSDGTGAFAALGVVPALLRTLATLGYEEPTPVQREAIPVLIAGSDVLAEAPTGTGKTAAFALPMLQRLPLGTAGEGSALGLVLVPTRELAMQVAEAFHRYGQDLKVRVLPVYGGQPIGQQLRGLHRGVDVVVATPGRAVDHLKRGSLKLDAVSTVVLDEADEMLDMGFAEDLETILSATPSGRQTALFSATISPTIQRIARKHLREPVRVNVRSEVRAADGAALVRQVAYVIRRADKLAALCRLLDIEDPASALVFGRTREEVDDLARALSGRGRDAAALHGGMSQDMRDRVMARFRDGSLDVLVATDVAARGLDIEHVSHVVNYDVPSDPDAYIHRIGRTGRAGREGTAITLVEPREHRLLRNIEAATHQRLEIAHVPTVADLRQRRLELLRSTLREALLGDGFDRYRAVVEPLAEEFDLVDIALAAVSLAAGEGSREEDDVELAQASLPTPFVRPSGPVPQPRNGPHPKNGRGQAFAGPQGRFGPPNRNAPEGRFGPPNRNAPPWAGGRPVRPGGPPSPRPIPSSGWARLYISGGREAGIRPADLVGAITNEARVGGESVGAIRIEDRFALVDVQADAAEPIMQALRTAKIKGRQLQIRRDGPRE